MQDLKAVLIGKYLLYYDYGSRLDHHLELLLLFNYHYVGVKTQNNLYYDVYNIK